MILDAIRKEDEGVYQVSMVHKDNSVISVIITLSLVAPPSVPRITVSMNNSLMVLVLKCEAEEGTELSYHWLKSGQSLPEDERHSLREENTALQVNNLTSTDCVNYTCVAANDLGRAEEHFHLIGNTTPTCSANSTANLLNLKAIPSISAAVICALGLCVVIWCTYKHYQEIQQWLRGQGRRTDEANVADSIYDEIRDEQAVPAAPEMVQLPYVYTDFIPRCHSAGRRQGAAQIEDFGYSAISPLEVQSASPIRNLVQLDLERLCDV
ncbi:hemicentin-2 [Megalops cyprinoides]|uniref:hemicentin-2 n=1 Tax=Megalops cyprinoides TaxID=118141 RepID=UPI00186450DE|nr:hemicentin-2 [Megalops cyprinoides]